MATWAEVGNYIDTENFKILEQAPYELIPIGGGGFRVETDYQNLEWQISERMTHSNFEWVGSMMEWAFYYYQRPEGHNFGFYLKGHQELGIDITDYVDYAKEWKHEDYLIFRFTRGGVNIENGEKYWKDMVKRVIELAPTDISEKWMKEFEDITGNSVEATMENWDYTLTPSGKIVWDTDNNKYIWVNDETKKEDGEGGIYDPETGYTYPPADKPPVGGSDTDYSSKGIFAIFFIFYDYVSLIYDFYYEFFDKMLNLSNYPAINKSYNPDVSKDAFGNFMSMVLIYYGSIMSVGLLLRLYRVYYAVKSL